MTSVTLWHGTTLSAAQQICDEGFHRVSTSVIVSDLAHQHGVDAAAVEA
jgi:hypothetical protein